jgi:nicotinamide mononucleotide transporter
MIFLPDQNQGALFIIIRWLISHHIEILATLTGLIYLIYSIRGQILLWLFGILSSALYIYVFFRSKIYADMCISIYYVIISIYGWYHWSFTTGKKGRDLPVSRLTLKSGIILAIVSVVLFLGIIFVLKNFTNSDIAFWDALITALSVTATWMLARKILEHWLIWIFVDMISVLLYIYKGLYPTVVLYMFYTTLAVLGYNEWKVKWRSGE